MEAFWGETKAKIVKSIIPDIVSEYVEAYGNNGIQAIIAIKKHLENEFFNAGAQSMMGKGLQNKFELIINEKNKKDLQVFSRTGKHGDIFHIRTKFQDYGFGKSNYIHPNLPKSMNFAKSLPGEVIVDVGFVDPSFLFEGIDFERCFSCSDKITKFYGYELDKFSVARSTVIMEMLRDPQTPLECVIEAWYSSCWWEVTNSRFLFACQESLKRERDTKVIRIIRYWIHRAKYKKKFYNVGRRKKMQDHTFIYSLSKVILYLKNKIDRVKMLRYLLLGDLKVFPHDEESTCDKKLVNVSINHSLEDFELTNDGTIFSTLPIVSIINKYVKSNEKNDIFSIVRNYLKDRLSSIRSLLSKGLLEVRFFNQTVELVNIPVLNEIKLLHPTIVLWSNVCDFLPRNEFLRICRYISTNKTRHFAHTISWTNRTKGTDLVDIVRQFQSENMEKQQKRPNRNLFPSSDEIEENSREILSVYHPDYFKKKTIMSNSLSLMGMILAGSMVPKWLEYFENGVGCECCKDSISCYVESHVYFQFSPFTAIERVLFFRFVVPKENLICDFCCKKKGEKKCSRCQLSYYCSAECQKKDWKQHKKVCRKNNFFKK